MLINPITKKMIQNYINDPSGGLGLYGASHGIANTVCNYVCEMLLGTSLKNNPNITRLDGKIDGIEEVRVTLKKFRLTVPGSQRKIARILVINNFDKLGHEAQNSMLKTLEEPPINTAIILCINYIDHVLETIVSRINIVNVLPVDLEFAINELKNEYDSSLIRSAYLLSGGDAELLKSILDNSQNELALAVKSAKKILLMPKSQRIAQIDNIIKSKEVSTEVLVEAILKIISANHKNFINNNDDNPAVSINRLRLVLNCYQDILNGANKKLALTSLLMKI